MYDLDSVEAFNLWIDNNSAVTEWNGVSLKPSFWNQVDNCFSVSGLGSCSNRETLSTAARNWNSAMGRASSFLSIWAYCILTGSTDIPNVVVEYDSTLGVYRFREKVTGIWITNSSGHFPYYREPSDSGSGGSSGTPSSSGYQFMAWSLVSSNPLTLQSSKTELQEIAKRYSGYVKQVDNYWFIVDVTGSLFLCTANGRRLAAFVDPDKTAAGQTNNYYTQEGDTNYNEYQGGDTIINEGDKIIYEGDTITNNSTTVYEEGDTTNNQFINIHDNTFQNADGSIYNIDDLYYDETNQTYYVNAHDEYVYNSTTNEYTTNNFLYAVTYHINYTSITYIGQTEEFEAETYVYYYELPDGRSSADLTAEELEQVSLAFTDVVNYARSTDSTDMRVLYHFDGNTEDSSYWSYCTEFDWVKGASLTYMDEGVFNGSLYLDETEHEFTITLPNTGDISGDFTLQFRYYQSHTLSPVKDSYIALGGEPRLYFTGSQYQAPSGTVIADTSVGTWNELCIMRKGTEYCYYVNGVCCLKVDLSTVYSNTITFHFGSEQQTYKKIDELRFTRAAVYLPGADYSPSAVPHDSNLSLILPDGERPIADEVLVLTKSENNLLDQYGFSDWTTADPVSGLSKYAAPSTGVDPWSALYKEKFCVVYNESYSDISLDGGSTSFSTSGTAFSSSGKISNYTVSGFRNGLMIPVNGYFYMITELLTAVETYSNWRASFNNNKTYCFSVVLADGTYSYIVFTVVNNLASTKSGSSVAQVDVYNGSFVQLSVKQLSSVYTQPTGASSQYFVNCISAIPTSGNTADIVYMELVEGTAPEFTASLDVAMYSSGELEESPVLAVRSNTPISTYTFGGVRPTYPERGQVWAMIEGHRIVSLQQYTGSAWVEVDGRIWTGSRWIPYSSFDVFMLQDCWDIVDSGEDSDYEYIYSQSGFWSWFQRSWNTFIKKIDRIIELLENSGGGEKSDSEKELDERSDTIISVFLNVIFNRKDDQGVDNNRITEDNLIDVGSILDKTSDAFNSGFKISQFFDELGNSWFILWFTPENAQQLDSVSGAAPAGEDEDPYNMQRYHDHMNSIRQSRGGVE